MLAASRALAALAILLVGVICVETDKPLRAAPVCPPRPENLHRTDKRPAYEQVVRPSTPPRVTALGRRPL